MLILLYVPFCVLLRSRLKPALLISLAVVQLNKILSACPCALNSETVTEATACPLLKVSISASNNTIHFARANF